MAKAVTASGLQARPSQGGKHRGHAHKAGLRGFLKLMGPGLVAGASDDDPSGIGTYAQVGAATGYGMLWLAWVTYPMMATVQYICAKIGMVSGRGLAGVLREHYPRWLLYLVVGGLAVANTINAGADLGAIAAAVNLMAPALPIASLIVPIALVLVAMEIWCSYRFIARTFKWLTLALFAYVLAAFFTSPDLGQLAWHTLVPGLTLDKESIVMLVAVLGTTISPYLFFWQASQEVEEEISRGKKKLWQRQGATNDDLAYAKWDVALGMFFSNLVMYFIMLTTAATLHQAGQISIESAAQAARALEPLAGSQATILFAVGIIGTGFLAVPVLTGAAAYAVADVFGWKMGLDKKPWKAPQFYIVIAGSTLIGMLVNYVGINPIKTLFWTAVINGVVAPPLLVVIMLVANNKQVMGDKVNGLAANIVGWGTTAAMGAAAIAMFVFW